MLPGRWSEHLTPLRRPICKVPPPRVAPRAAGACTADQGHRCYILREEGGRSHDTPLMWVQASHSILPSTPGTRMQTSLLHRELWHTKESWWPGRLGDTGCPLLRAIWGTHPGLTPLPTSRVSCSSGVGALQAASQVASGWCSPFCQDEEEAGSTSRSRAPFPPSMVSRAWTATRPPPCQATGKSLILFVARKSSFPRDGVPSGTAFYCRPASLTCGHHSGLGVGMEGGHSNRGFRPCDMGLSRPVRSVPLERQPSESQSPGWLCVCPRAYKQLSSCPAPVPACKAVIPSAAPSGAVRKWRVTCARGLASHCVGPPGHAHPTLYL